MKNVRKSDSMAERSFLEYVLILEWNEQQPSFQN